MGVIDFHSHILPEMDDGSRNLETSYEAVKRLRMNSDLCRQMITNGKDIVYRRFDVRRTAREHEMLFIKMTSHM